MTSDEARSYLTYRATHRLEDMAKDETRLLTPLIVVDARLVLIAMQTDAD